MAAVGGGRLGGRGARGAAALYKAADRGGDLVFDYAGGVGIRSGDTADVGHLLTAGLYEQAMAARQAHRPGEADTLLTLLARLRPGDPYAAMAYAQSLLEDRKDPKAALAALDRIAVPDTAVRMKARIGSVKADVFVAAGMTDSARALLTKLVSQFPTNMRLKDRLAKLH